MNTRGFLQVQLRKGGRKAWPHREPVPEICTVSNSVHKRPKPRSCPWRAQGDPLAMATVSGGALGACREKFGPRPIFKIFSLVQIRVDQEKKEVTSFFSWSTRIWSSEKILKIGRGPNFSLHARNCKGQGSPADRAMTMHGIAVLPPVRRLADHCKQIWTPTMPMMEVESVLDLKSHCGAGIYSPNWPKFWLLPQCWENMVLVQEEHLGLQLATMTFQNTRVQITTGGRRLLGIPLGTLNFKAKTSARESRSGPMPPDCSFAAISQLQPHAAFSAFTHALLSWLVFLAWITSELVDHCAYNPSKLKSVDPFFHH